MKKQLSELMGLSPSSPKSQSLGISLPVCKPDVSHKMSELQKQEREGYEVALLNDGEEVFYREGERSLAAKITYRTNGFILYTHSLKHWRTATGNNKLSPEEYDLVVSRIRDHLS